MDAPKLPKVLCVDDEPRVLEGIALHLRKNYELHVAWSGEEALKRLKEMGGAAVVVSDMRMPGMDGATLLSRVRKEYPLAARILLTGESGRDSAVHAVNEGQILRFLTKPCPPERLKAAVEAGVDHFRLLGAERVLLQETLLGCIQALIDVLAITSPLAFGRANRVKTLAMDIAGSLGWTHYWQLEAAAMLSQIGYVALPADVVEKLHYGKPLSAAEQALAAGVPEIANKLLGNIPRLEPVIQILMAMQWTEAQRRRLGDGTIGFGARVLGLVIAYDSLTAQGNSVDDAVRSLRSQSETHDEKLLQALADRVGAQVQATEIRPMPLRDVAVGMIFEHEVLSPTGAPVAPHNFEVTEAFVQKMSSLDPAILTQTVKMRVPTAR